MNSAEEFKVHLDIQARFRDTDAMGHVNNAVYLSYLELARMKYWETLTGSKDYSKVEFILARAELDYRSPVMPGEDVRVYVRVGSLGRSSWTFDYKIVEPSSGRLVAEGKTVQCSYDYERKKVKRVDEALRRRLMEFEGIDIPGVK